MSELEDRSIDIYDSEGKKQKRLKKKEQSLRYLWDTIKQVNMCIFRFQKKERERGRDSI